MVHKNVQETERLQNVPALLQWKYVCFLKWKNPLSIESHDVANAGSSSNGYIIATVERNLK